MQIYKRPSKCEKDRFEQVTILNDYTISQVAEKGGRGAVAFSPTLNVNLGGGGGSRAPPQRFGDENNASAA